MIHSIDEKTVFVNMGEDLGSRQFNLSKVKPAKLSSNHNILQRGMKSFF